MRCAAARSPPSKGSRVRTASCTRCSRRSSTSLLRNAASARPARSCRAWRCSRPILSRPATRRATRSPAISAGAAPTTTISTRSCGPLGRRDMAYDLTGKAKYAEDYRADGMVFCRILGSPMPHGRVKKIDASAALKLKGVLGVLTAKDVPAFPPPQNPILTDEPHFVGEPILAVAAETEQLAQDAIDLIKIEYEALPFVVDPLDSLHPGGPNARSDGNV